jgi:hypothetical protein
MDYLNCGGLLARSVSDRVAGLVDRAIDLAAGFLGGAFGAAGHGEAEEEGGADDAEDGIGVAHAMQGTRGAAPIDRARISPVEAR